MAKYDGSMYGDLSGQQLGVVAAKWKGIKYVRKYVIPNNPQTDAQQLQRAIFKNISQFMRRLVDTILNPYTLPAPKKMSAFNKMVSVNTKLQVAETIDYSLILLLQGGLYTPGITSVSGASTPHTVIVTWDDTLQGEAADTDIAVIVIYDLEIDTFFVDVLSTRTDGSVTVSTPGINLGDHLHIYLGFVDAALTICTDSDYATTIVVASHP